MVCRAHWDMSAKPYVCILVLTVSNGNPTMTPHMPPTPAATSVRYGCSARKVRPTPSSLVATVPAATSCIATAAHCALHSPCKLPVCYHHGATFIIPSWGFMGPMGPSWGHVNVGGTTAGTAERAEEGQQLQSAYQSLQRYTGEVEAQSDREQSMVTGLSEPTMKETVVSTLRGSP